ncbi:MAG: PorT family protein [Bacteroidales bacterium]|nr:PorT family protein [Bacteroidales bacterium]
MKKVFFILAGLVFLGFTSSYAQYPAYGAKLGLSFPGFQDERIASERITPAISLIGNFHITRSFVMQMEVGYELKGNKFTYEVWDAEGLPIEDSTYVEKTNMGYVTVPLLFKYNLGSSNKFYLQAGGYYGYLLNAGFSGKMNNELVSRVKIKDGLSPHDYGVLVGGGLETPFRKGLSMLLDVKYHHGMRDLNIDPDILGHSNPVKTKSFVMSMGLLIDID